MVIGNSYFTSVPIFPTKNNSELIINPNTVLSNQRSMQRFQMVPWRYDQILQFMGRIEHV